MASSDLSVVFVQPVEIRVAFQFFADLVVIAKEFYPIPFRTRPSKPSASMVLRLKPRESRTLPGLPRTENLETRQQNKRNPRSRKCPGLFRLSPHVRPPYVSRHPRPPREHIGPSG